MKTLEFEGGYIIKLERGEEVTESLEQFLKEQKIPGGVVTGLGGVGNAELGFYDLPLKTYHRKKFPGNQELIHYAGNITLVDNKPFVHAHAVVSGPDFKAWSGHFFSAIIAITGEFIIHPEPWHIERKLDEEVGLNLMYM